MADPISAPAAGYFAVYADKVIARGPDVVRAELIRLQSKIITAQQALTNGDPMAAAKALNS